MNANFAEMMATERLRVFRLEADRARLLAAAHRSEARGGRETAPRVGKRGRRPLAGLLGLLRLRTS
jgi:hypothetical protein